MKSSCSNCSSTSMFPLLRLMEVFQFTFPSTCTWLVLTSQQGTTGESTLMSSGSFFVSDYGLRIDLLCFRCTITPRTKMIVLDTLHNPMGKVFTRAEIEAIVNITKEFDLLAILDEVVRSVNPCIFTQPNAALNLVQLFNLQRQRACADRNSPRYVGENTYGRLHRKYVSSYPFT